ncbi:BHLH transcription factor [Rhynchospora pubera]|uniref:BHLH transcription factor n=1 Tax=Rhynchospora pubera TaxID=906938 RepID=A0AAV8F4P3_9POAL|nr:BHLH transcription factor [Rhynchospora pubera]KAJ4786076.1 BHLH transcription factor [Rhynchospora pubera]KAJ4805094.1 BHLH transcription factor [Rhynchospora pubera]
MVSREKKIKAGLHDKLQLLRSLTKSNALNETSIVLDASRYIKELKQKVIKLNRELAASQSTMSDNQSPLVTVDTLENGFLINVFLNKTNPGLLVSILEAFEELGLSVMEASASCADSFCLEAFGGENQAGDLDAYVVKEAVLQAIRNCDED